MSSSNEKRVWGSIHYLSLETFKNYPTKVEDDLEILSSSDISDVTRNSVLLRLGEKELLHTLISSAKKFERLLNLEDI